MELRETGELGRITRNRKRYGNGGCGIHKGRRDDASVPLLTPGIGRVSILDLRVENIHFDLSLLQPVDWGESASR